MVADYAGTGLTVGRHPMAHCRARLHRMNAFRAGDLKLVRHGVKARIAGQVIARQRPGTAQGFIFLSIELAERGRTRITRPFTLANEDCEQQAGNDSGLSNLKTSGSCRETRIARGGRGRPASRGPLSAIRAFV